MGMGIDINGRTAVTISRACDLAGVSRRTIYNWLSKGKIEHVRTAGGSVRIFTDTLWRSGGGNGNSESGTAADHAD